MTNELIAISDGVVAQPLLKPYLVLKGCLNQILGSFKSWSLFEAAFHCLA